MSTPRVSRPGCVIGIAPCDSTLSCPGWSVSVFRPSHLSQMPNTEKWALRLHIFFAEKTTTSCVLNCRFPAPRGGKTRKNSGKMRRIRVCYPIPISNNPHSNLKLKTLALIAFQWLLISFPMTKIKSLESWSFSIDKISILTDSNGWPDHFSADLASCIPGRGHDLPHSTILSFAFHTSGHLGMREKIGR